MPTPPDMSSDMGSADLADGMPAPPARGSSEESMDTQSSITANDEETYINISGGTIIACGASSMAETFDSSSTQASMLYNTNTAAEAGTTLAVEDTDGNVLLSWEVPCSFSSALVSFPQMETGGTYIVAIGDNTEEITLFIMNSPFLNTVQSLYLQCSFLFCYKSI